MTQPPHPPAPERRKRWPWIVAAAALVVVIAGVAATLVPGRGEDPGVVACNRAADRAATGQTADDSDDGDVQLLQDSRHADLREVGVTIERVSAGGDLSSAVQVGVQMMAACARHGVVISPA